FRYYRYNRREHNVTLREIADTFLFQFFTQGLRCSDVQFLRWSHFKLINDVLYLDYIMIKTKKEMRLNMTYMALKMLNIPLFRLCPEIEDKIFNLEKQRTKLLQTKKSPMTRDIDEQIYSIYSAAIEELSKGKFRNHFVSIFLNMMILKTIKT